MNQSSEWGTHPFYWYFTSALPRSLLAAYPLFLLGVLLDRRVFFYILPVLSFVLLYSKLPHKELRFIISSIPIFNFAAAVAASRVYNNRKKSFGMFLYIAMLGLMLGSLACAAVLFMASYENYPSGYALKALHRIGGATKNSDELSVHIDTFSAMNGISRFCEDNYPWRYSKEEENSLQDFQMRNFTYLLNENPYIEGFKCLKSVDGFSRVHLRTGFPPISLEKARKVFIHGNIRNTDITNRSCSLKASSSGVENCNKASFLVLSRLLFEKTDRKRKLVSDIKSCSSHVMEFQLDIQLVADIGYSLKKD